MKTKASSTYFRKYREIIIAVALFLAFDISVLILNFYTSFQIDQDAVSINLSGRQRYVSQRVARTLLELDAARNAGLPVKQGTLDELRNGAKIFQASMVAFRHGGVVPGGDGKPVRLEAVESERARELQGKAEALWNPYYALLQPLLQSNNFTPAQLSAALTYSQANNLALLNVANDFVTEAQAIGASRASRLRTIQTVGIALSLLNFAYTVFASLRHLFANDRKVEIAQKETAEILDTVKEGLFLLDPQFKIGSQFSTSLGAMLGRKVEAGADFLQMLGNMVPDEVLALATDYIDLLFGDHVKEALIGDLNPLTSIEVMVRDSNGAAARRFLTLQFNRVREDGVITHLLVTVFDVTTQVELERALVDAKGKAKAEMEVMFDLLKINPGTLNLFLKSAEQTLLEINELLGSAGGALDYRRTVNTVFRKIHTLKGEAATLGIDMFETLAQQFETLLAGLREKGTVSGDDLLALPFPLEEFLQRIAMVRSLTARLAAYHDAFAPAADNDAFADNLSRLAQRVASDHGKQVKLVTELDLLHSLPRTLHAELKDITIQLLRNAVTHGIEPALEREELSKPAAGNIYVALKPSDAGEYELTLRDDGRGLSPQAIRAALLRSGRYSDEQLAELDDRQVVMKIFEPGFSTAKEVSRDAGHGVGMDVVKHRIEQLGARLRISSRTREYTQFSIQFAI
jgi:two-component system, chemotaxis family, sensor kinase CheA